MKQSIKLEKQQNISSYDPYSFIQASKSLLLEDLKNQHRQQVKKSKQLQARLNRFTEQANTNPQKILQKKLSPKQKNTSLDYNQQFLRGSNEDSQSILSATQKNLLNSKKIKRGCRPSLVMLSSSVGSSKSDNSCQGEQNQNKRNLIYQHQSYKEKFQNLDQTTIQTNNRLFQLVFLKKQSLSQSVSTTSSQQKGTIKKKQRLTFLDFHIGKQLGAGKSGQVFAARHISTGFLCAIKRIKKTKVDSKTLTQLIRQIKIQTYLQHPNIVKLYNFFTDQKHIYLVLEYCASGDLYSLLKKAKKMEEDTVRNIIKQVCKAIQYMHENTILHRDLKPENILYHNGMIKICDFGWSISSTVSRETFCGTPLYVSPQLLKRNNYSNKIDVWSIGILTHELLFGRVPFDIFSEGDLIKIVQDDIKFAKHIAISPQSKSFMLSCLQKDPMDRLSVAELLEHPFLSAQKQQ